MGTLAPLSGQMVFDNNGVLAPGALAYFTDAGTSTPKTVYQDGDETTPHEDPVEADGNGRWPAIFVPFGSYKLRITTAAGSAIGPTIDDIPNAAPTDPAEGVDADAILTTGDVWFTLKNGTRAGAVRLNGRTIGNAASGGTERANADTADLFAYLWDNIADAQAAVSSGRGATAAADFAANKTITLPDWRAASAIGFDDMGSTAASRLGSAPVVSGSGILAGSILGETANVHTLTSGEMPSHTHSFSATTGAEGIHNHTGTTDSGGSHNHTGTTDAGGAHSHSSAGGHNFVDNPGSGGTLTGLTVSGGAAFGLGATDTEADHTHTFTSSTHNGHTHTITTANSSSHTHTVSGTSGSTGSGTAHNVLGRVGTGTWLIKL